MPVRKRVSSIFKPGKKDVGPPTRHLQLPNPSMSSIEEEEGDVRDITAATHASLQDEIARLEGHMMHLVNQVRAKEEDGDQAEREIQRLSELLESQAQSHSASLNELHSLHANQLALRDESHAASMTRLQAAQSDQIEGMNATIRDLSTQVSDARDHITQLQRERTGLQEENRALEADYRTLHGMNQQYETWVQWAQGRQSEQDRHIQGLTSRLDRALQPIDDETRRVLFEDMKWAREREELQETYRLEKTRLQEQVKQLSGALQKKTDEHVRDRDAWESRIHILETEFVDQKKECLESQELVQALETNKESLEEEWLNAQCRLHDYQQKLSALLSSCHDLFGADPTPRQLLFAKLFVRRFPRQPRNEEAESRFHQRHHVEDLTTAELDEPLDETGLIDFVNDIASGTAARAVLQRLQFRRCPECKRNKIFGVKDESNQTLIEYPMLFRQSCCGTCPLCTTCLGRKLRKAIAEDWWYDLDCQQWLKCPVDGCETPLGIASIDSLDAVLGDFPNDEPATLKTMYRRACALRAALTEAQPRPTLEAISIAIGLHKQLAVYGFLDNRFDVATIDQNDTSEAFTVGEVLMGQVDRIDERIPIFSALLHQADTAKECAICLEPYHDFRIESQTEWVEACEGYQGRWMSEMLVFPTKDDLECDHDMNVCKQCLQRHLQSQLEQHGRSVSGRLSCPICNRILSEQEIGRLASAETRESYDHYLFLSHIQQEPNFRSCLNPAGCPNGQIYEQDEYADPLIICDLCSFEMCFTHQMPWHAGQSCAQYDSQREHGDPEYQQTQQWMHSNSKICPGRNCNVNIEKGNACFHMTCTQCRHEFCWECLGDWSRINPTPGTYVKEAHNAGCWFRNNNLEPTQISGTHLQDALRRRGR